MKCPRCGLPVDPEDRQCNVCGEILTAAREKVSVAAAEKATARSAKPEAEELPFLNYNPAMPKYGIWWMIACAVFAVACIGVAFVHYSIEAMWASFISAALIFVPVLFILFGRSLQIAHSFRKELMIVVGVVGAVACFYLLAKGIEKSDIQVETSGINELATNENFTRTLVTGIVCMTILIGLIPIGKMVIRGMALGSGTDRFKTDTQREMHTRSSENTTAVELRKLELSHDLELRRLELEQERLRLEAQQVALLSDNRTQLLTDERQRPANAPNTPPPPPPPPAQ